MTTGRDVWVRAAMTDDDIVAGILLGLKHAPVVSRSVFDRLRWGSRRPRSRNSRLSVGLVRKDGSDSQSGVRASPTTPLSWSGGSGSDGSASPTAAVEDARRQATCSTSAGSRSKTFSELRDEEDVLLKERRQLKKAMASLRATHKEQASKNETLKRIKLDLDSNCTKKPILEALDQKENAGHNNGGSKSSFNNISPVNPLPGKDSCKNADKTSTSRGGGSGFFVLPDLNMTPSDEDSGTDILYGSS